MRSTRIRADDVRYIERVLQRKERLQERPRVRLSTIHASKGGEADHVVLLTEMADALQGDGAGP